MPTLKEKLDSGSPVLGTFLQIPAAEIAEIVALGGFDCAIVDTEHGMFGVDVGLSLVRACDAAGLAAVLRVPGVQEHRITQALDFGASAVMIPNVKTRRDAERAVMAARSSIKEGENIADPLAHSKVFPAMVTRMIAVGEKTGELEKMLTKIADFYESEVDAAVTALTSLIEPMVIAVLGVVIGGIVIALFMPIFKISTLVGRQ